MIKNIRYQRLFALLRCVLSDKALDSSLFERMESKDWGALMECAQRQGVLAVCFEAFDKSEVRPDIDNLMEWLGQMSYMETCYEEYKNCIKELTSFFKRQQIKTVLMKGYGLSLNYPRPNHRQTGDIDLYHCGNGEFADQMVKDRLGLEVKQNEEKHSTYDYGGIHVENHATIICELEHKALRKVEKFLEDELTNNSTFNEDVGCWLPSPMFNAVYLPLHLGGHFVYGEASLRQVVDYALMVANATKVSEGSNKFQKVSKGFPSHREHQDKISSGQAAVSGIDWDKVKELVTEGGYYKFLCCLNGICIDSLGIPTSCFPVWERDESLESRVLDEILNPQSVDASSIVGKIKRYFSNRCKYGLVYGNESHLKGFFLRLRSWLIWKWGIGGKNIWKR